MNSRSLFYLLAGSALVLDQVTKVVVDTQLTGGRVLEIIPGFVRIVHVTNTGIVFGLLSGSSGPWKTAALALIAVVAAGILAFYFLRYPVECRVFHGGLGLVCGGAAGNILDRFIRGVVVDFIDVHVRNHFTWPTFNIADTAICVGIGLMLLDMHRGAKVLPGEAKDVP